jgi:hypothetical protein
VRPDFIFRSGKYQGKTYSYVRRVDPRWLSWVEANRPEMLKEHGQPRSLDTQFGGNPRKLDTQEEGEETRDPWTSPHTFYEIAQKMLRERGEL